MILKVLLTVIYVLVMNNLYASNCANIDDSKPIEWYNADYRIQFVFLYENYGEKFNKEYWENLTPQQQAEYIKYSCDLSVKRYKEVKAEIESLLSKWDISLSKKYYNMAIGRGFNDKVNMAKIWFGTDMSVRLNNNLTSKTDILKKYSKNNLSEEDIDRAKPLFSSSMIRLFQNSINIKNKLKKDIKKAKQKTTTGKVKRLKALAYKKNIGNNVYAKQSEFYDGSKFSKDYDSRINLDINNRDKEKYLSGKTKNIGIKNTLKSSSVKPPVNNKEEKSVFLPDSYGITLYLSDGKTRAFRNEKEAKKFLRELPDSSITRVIFYGHGSPGLQTVGNYAIDSHEAENVLKGKMKDKGVIEFHGCNTASVGTEISLNPLVGASMLLRRILYFSVPYFADRLNGVDKEEAKRMWESGWNKDLARETSYKLNNVVVCGYSTFGLVPERLYGKPKATPGFTVGKKVCYLGGKKVEVD